jgi:hypothetical protein
MPPAKSDATFKEITPDCHVKNLQAQRYQAIKKHHSLCFPEVMRMLLVMKGAYRNSIMDLMSPLTGELEMYSTLEEDSAIWLK